MAKKLLISTALIMLTTSAFAADLPARMMAPVYAPPPPVFLWTGFYLGGQVGYEFGSSSYSFQERPIAPALEAPDIALRTIYSSTHGSGVAGGGHIGYNYEMLGFGIGSGLVVGIEGDVNGSDFQSEDPEFNAKMRSEIKGSVRGRVGVAFDRALFYATGGAAFSQIKYGALVSGYSTYTRNRVGYTVGGGIDYAITPNWSLQIEYRYSDYGTFGVAPGETIFRVHEKDNLVQVGFSYLFTSPIVPVVARY